MSLIQSGSEKAFKKNVETEIEHGKPQKQAVAIAYETQRANDYEPSAIETVPEGVTLETLNANNRKYWAHQGGESSTEEA